MSLCLCVEHLPLVWIALASAVAYSQDLQKPISELVDRYRADARAEVGVHVVRLGDGAVLCDLGAHRPMTPASNQKILTAAVALKRLGADFAFSTRLVRDGDALVVFGDGDPTTGDPRLAEARKESIYAAFDRWAQACKAKGAVKLAGPLIIRAGIFSPPFAHPDWPDDQLDRWYGAPISGVNFNDNCYDIAFALKDKQVAPVVSPLSAYLALDNQVRIGPKQAWSFRTDAAGTKLTLLGTVSGSSTEPLSVAAPDPVNLYGAVLADRLTQAGVFKGRVNIVTSTGASDARGPDKEARPIAAETTLLPAVLGRCNKNSLNMMAECLLLRAAVEGSSPATWEKAAQVAQRVLLKDYRLDGAQFVVSDGSGFSRKDRASPRTLTTLLRALSGQDVFVQSLAVGGADGSLQRRFTDAALRGKVLGKTGSLAGVSALSGYVTGRDGKCELAFSILVNGQTYGKKLSARWLEDSIGELLVKAADAAKGPAPAGR